MYFLQGDLTGLFSWKISNVGISRVSLGFLLGPSCSPEKALLIICLEGVGLAASVLRAEWWEMNEVFPSSLLMFPESPCHL